ncbi:MAG TPA: hypothetical protein VFL73_07430 [Solirubrobacteraceae bacterium]|nr:hypothetical protein [Solirubrobacteraceae bacterium]
MSDPGGGDKTAWAVTGGALLVVVCCAGGPLLATAFGSLAVGAVLGIGAGVAVLALGCAVLIVRHRSRTRRSTPT